MRWFNLMLPVLLLVHLSGCGGDRDVEFSSNEDPTDSTVEDVDPTSLQYAPHLDIDFAQMEEPLPGLFYQDLRTGSGPVAEAGRSITVHYTGHHPDGTVFDSSHDRDEPFTVWLGVGQVIEGWDEGLDGMREGGRRLLVVPPQLGYGESGAAGGQIPPNAVLVFDVELLSVD